MSTLNPAPFSTLSRQEMIAKISAARHKDGDAAYASSPHDAAATTPQQPSPASITSFPSSHPVLSSSSSHPSYPVAHASPSSAPRSPTTAPAIPSRTPTRITAPVHDPYSPTSLSPSRSSKATAIAPPVVHAHVDSLFTPLDSSASAAVDAGEVSVDPTPPPPSPRSSSSSLRVTAAELVKERERVSQDPWSTTVEKLLIHASPFTERDSEPARHLARVREMQAVLSHEDFLPSLQAASPVLLVWLANTRRISHLLQQVCESPRSPLLLLQQPNPAVQSRMRQGCMEALLRLSTYPNHFSEKLWKAKSDHSGRLLPTLDTLLSLYLAHYAQTVEVHQHNAAGMAAVVAQRHSDLLRRETVCLVRLEQRFDEVGGEHGAPGGDKELALVCPPAVPVAVVWGDRLMLQWAKEQWARWLLLFHHQPQLWEAVVSLAYNPSVRAFLVRFIDEAGRQRRERTATDWQLHQAEELLSLALSSGYATLTWFHQLPNRDSGPSAANAFNRNRANAESNVCQLLHAVLTRVEQPPSRRWLAAAFDPALINMTKEWVDVLSALSSAKASGVERRLDEEAVVGCLLHHLQLWPVLVDCHHRLAAVQEQKRLAELRDVVHQLDIHLAVHSNVLPLTLQLLRMTLAEDWQLPPALTVRLQVFLLRYFELLVHRRLKDAHHALLTLHGIPVLLSLYRGHFTRGGPVKTSLYFLLLAILCSDDQALQTALLVEHGLYPLLLDDFLAETAAESSRAPAQTGRLLALSVLASNSAVHRLIDSDPRLVERLLSRPALYASMRDSLALKDFTITWHSKEAEREEPALLLDRWLTRAQSRT